jgi:hypothetical protein
MKRIAILLFLFIPLVTTQAQFHPNLGIIAGTDYYMGDINTEKLFYSPRYMFGPILRFGIDARSSIRIHAIYANLHGSDYDFNNVITQRNLETFSLSLLNVAAQYEYNFFSFKTGDNFGSWTPYMFGGIGYSFIAKSNINPQISSEYAPNNHLTIPFGIGLKLNLSDRISTGLEWSYNKAFTDRLDGAFPPIALRGTKMYNNDWYSFLGLFITYKFFNFAGNCPAYY